MGLSAIKSEINTLLTNVSSINEVYDYHNLGGLSPYVTFEFSSLDNEILDNKHNLRTWSFQIIVLQEIGIKQRKDATDIINTVIEDIVNKIDKNYTLNGNADGGVTPVSGEKGQIVNENGTILFGELIIQAKEDKLL